MQFGRFDEGLEQARLAMEYDPLDYPMKANYGLYLWDAGRLDEARIHLETLLTQKDLWSAHALLGQVYAALAVSSRGKASTDYFVKSVREAGTVQTHEEHEAEEAKPTFLKWSDVMFAQAYAARGDRASAEVYVSRLESGFAAGKLSASSVAWAQAAIGNYSRVLDLLEMGLLRHEREMLYINVIPLFRPIHSDPRFQQIVKSMNL